MRGVLLRVEYAVFGIVPDGADVNFPFPLVVLITRLEIVPDVLGVLLRLRSVVDMVVHGAVGNLEKQPEIETLLQGGSRTRITFWRTKTFFFAKLLPNLEDYQNCKMFAGHFHEIHLFQATIWNFLHSFEKIMSKPSTKLTN